MYKVINPFDIQFGTRYYPVFIKIEIEKRDGGKRLSISGVESPLRSGNCRGACGQIDMHMDDEYLSEVRFQKGWDRVMVDSLLFIWKHWHLNDLRNKPIPHDVLQKLETFPETKRIPAWI